MMYDHRVIADQGTPGGMKVLAHRQEVIWRDGTRVLLMPVLAGDRPMVTLRAVAVGDGRLQLVDLEALSPALGLSLRHSPDSHAQSLVHFTLRRAWGSGPAFLAEVNRQAKGTWHPMPGGMAWVPAARAIDADLMPATAPTAVAAWMAR